MVTVPASLVRTQPAGGPRNGGLSMTSETDTPPATQTSPVASRKFGISDLMALIAGIALAISAGARDFVNLVEQIVLLSRTIAANQSARYRGRPHFWWQRVEIHWSTVLWYGCQVFEALVLSMTLAYLLVRLRPPRPPFRALLRQPGMVAGLAVVFGYFWVFGWLDRFFGGRMHLRTGTAIAVGGTVAAAWAVLALSRKWKSEPSWIDCLGRLLGAAAIAVGVLTFTQFGI